MQQISRGKTDRLQYATARFTTSDFDGYRLRDHLLARLPLYASYRVLVHRLVPLLHASSGPRLATTPLRFANTSPPSGCVGDLHPQAAIHARRTEEAPGKPGAPPFRERAVKLAFTLLLRRPPSVPGSASCESTASSRSCAGHCALRGRQRLKPLHAPMRGRCGLRDEQSPRPSWACRS